MSSFATPAAAVLRVGRGCGGAVARQARYARVKESGPEMARRKKLERDARRPEDIVYRQHLSDYEVRKRGVEPSTGEMHDPKRERLTREHFRDESGAIDYFEYISYNIHQRGRGDAERYTYSHPTSIPYRQERLRGHRKKMARSGKDSRWTPYRNVAGFRIVGQRKIEDQRKREAEYTTVEETVTVKVPNPYKVLSLANNATAKHAAANYRKLAKKYHPDAPGGSAEKMAEVNEAYAKVRRIIREGGPLRSPTALAGQYHETEETVRVKRHKDDRRRGGAGGIPKMDVDDDVFELEPSARAEKEEMRRMAVEFKSTLRAKEFRQVAKEEVRQRMLDGFVQPPSEYAATRWMRNICVIGLFGVWAIQHLIDDTSLSDFRRVPDWSNEGREVYEARTRI